jgi:hypothetical protein
LTSTGGNSLFNQFMNPSLNNPQNNKLEDKYKAFDDLDSVVIPSLPAFGQQENFNGLNFQASNTTPTVDLGGNVSKSQSAPISEKKANVDLLGEDFFDTSSPKNNTAAQEV